MSAFVERSRRDEEKTTFGEVLIVALVLLVIDAFLAFSSLAPVLPALGILELVVIVLWLLKDAWDALPRSIQKVLS